MIYSKEQAIALNYLSRGEGEAALLLLADIAYKYYAHQALINNGEQGIKDKGAALFAEWLKGLPKGLCDGYESSRAN